MVFSRAEQWSVPSPAADVRARVIEILRSRRAKVVDVGGGTIEARSGSQLLARLEVSLVPKRWLPLRATVTISTSQGAETAVAVALEDGLGVGATGTGARYEEIFDETIDALRRATT